MSGTVRFVIAAAFALLWLVMPEADPVRLAFLQTKTWLTDEVLTQFEGDAAEDRPSTMIPPLRVDVAIDSRAVAAERRTDAVRAELAARLARAPRAFARATRKTGFDESLPPLGLSLRIGANGFRATLLAPSDDLLPAPLRDPEARTRELRVDGSTGYYPDRYSLLPAFLAIILAIVTGSVIPALLLGGYVGALLTTGGSLFGGAHELVVGTIYADVLSDTFNLEIIAFVLFLFMAIGVMTRSGGVQGLADQVRKLARGPVSTQLATYLIGIGIFFDDYANCVITGTTMRPISDRVGIAREKLAYIVDSTAAPIAGISIFSTWVAYEISMFAPQLPEVTRDDGTVFRQSEGFSVFVSTLPYRFYCIFTLVMVLATILLRRDFGPMGAAQRRAAEEGKPYGDDARPMISKNFDRLEPDPAGPFQAMNAFVPLLALVLATIGGIVWIGWANAAASDPASLHGSFGDALRAILDNTASQTALWRASLLALFLATLMALFRARLSLGTLGAAALRAAQSLGFAVVILVLAWTIGATCSDLGTAQYLTAAFEGRFPPWTLPAVMFLLASLVSFSTGTSYGTMAILLPNVVVLAHATGEADATHTGVSMMVLTIGAVLEGSIFGDHCSPISDTTVLSSVSTGSDHLHHVRTQAPYALTVMAVAMVCGYLPMALLGATGWPLAWAAGITAIVALLLAFGKRAHGREPQAATA